MPILFFWSFLLEARPEVVLFEASLAVTLLLLRFLNELVVQQVRPSKPVTGHLIKQSLEEAFKLGTHIFRILDWVLDNQLNERVDLVCVKRRLPYKELVQDHPQRPQVNSVVVGLLLYQFRGHIERGPFNRMQDLRVGGHCPRKAEVAELDHTICREEDILRFHVPVNNAV